MRINGCRKSLKAVNGLNISFRGASSATTVLFLLGEFAGTFIVKKLNLLDTELLFLLHVTVLSIDFSAFSFNVGS